VTALDTNPSDASSDAPVDDSPGAGSSPRSLRRTLLTVARLVFTLAVVAAVVYATVSQWSGVQAYLQTLAWPIVIVALLTVMVGLVTATLAWRASLRYTGHTVPIHSAYQIYVVGLMAKYLPGSVWAFVLQMELGRRAKLPRSAAFLASIVVAGIGATVAMVLGLFVIPALLSDNIGLATGALVLIPISMVCAHPKVLTWLLRRLAALTRR